MRNWEDLGDIADIWAEQEFGSYVTYEERDLRADYGARIAKQWAEFSGLFEQKKMLGGPLPLLANEVCLHLVRAFQAVTTIDFTPRAIQVMEYITLQPDTKAALRMLMAHLEVDTPLHRTPPRRLDFPSALITTAEQLLAPTENGPSDAEH